MATTFKEKMEETPILEDTLLDQLGEKWMDGNHKAFPSFLAYLNYQVYGIEHPRERRARRQEEKEIRFRKALSAVRRHREF